MAHRVAALAQRAGERFDPNAPTLDRQRRKQLPRHQYSCAPLRARHFPDLHPEQRLDLRQGLTRRAALPHRTGAASQGVHAVPALLQRRLSRPPGQLLQAATNPPLVALPLLDLVQNAPESAGLILELERRFAPPRPVVDIVDEPLTCVPDTHCT